MQVKLSDIVKFPVKYSVCCEEAIDQCDKTIEIDEEKLRNIICSEYYPSDERATLLSTQIANSIKDIIREVK